MFVICLYGCYIYGFYTVCIYGCYMYIWLLYVYIVVLCIYGYYMYIWLLFVYVVVICSVSVCVHQGVWLRHRSDVYPQHADPFSCTLPLQLCHPGQDMPGTGGGICTHTHAHCLCACARTHTHSHSKHSMHAHNHIHTCP